MTSAGYSTQPIVRRFGEAPGPDYTKSPDVDDAWLDEAGRHARLHEEMDLEREAEMVERVVDALEARVIDELERRGIWRTPGVF